MENLTAQQVSRLTDAIFVRTGFDLDFKLLVNLQGENFFTMDEAIDFVRAHFQHCHVELSTLEQAMLGNAQWDNH